MNPDQKPKILIMAAALALAVVGCVVVFFLNGKKGEEPPTTPNQVATAPAPAGTSTPGAAPMPGMTPSPGAVPMPGGMTTAAMPGVAVKTLPPPPGTPPIPGAPALLPPPSKVFEGGPEPDWYIQKKQAEARARWLRQHPNRLQIPVSAIPAFAATKDRGWRRPEPVGGSTSANERERDLPIGRHAGWIYNSNGQVIAILEESDGTVRSVRIGDEVGNYRVKAITSDTLVLVDIDTGREQQLKLQGLDTFPTKSKTVEVEATPAMPAWGGR